MAKKPTIIEINGRKYNADNGEMLGSGVDHASPSVSGQMIDGFAAPHRTRKKPASAKALHAATQKSKKLHPLVAQAAKKRQIKNTTKVKKVTAPQATKISAKNELAGAVKAEREARAKQQAKSPIIARFSNNTPVSTTTTNRAEATQVAVPAVKPTRRKPEPEPEEKTSWFQSLRESRPKFVPTAATVGVTLLLVGYITYLNLPNMALRVAASRAGFEASLPGYKPSGFSLEGPISYAPGQIAVRFGSAADDRQFELVQRESTWDSQSLLDNFVVRENKRYVTFQESGLTIYVYDDSNATWVNNGIWYTVEGDSLLSSEQLLKIATSL